MNRERKLVLLWLCAYTYVLGISLDDKTFDDKLLILVHGVGGSYRGWTDYDYDYNKNSAGYKEIEKKNGGKPLEVLGIICSGNMPNYIQSNYPNTTGRVYVYSFSGEGNSSISSCAREFGDRGFDNLQRRNSEYDMSQVGGPPINGSSVYTSPANYNSTQRDIRLLHDINIGILGKGNCWLAQAVFDWKHAKRYDGYFHWVDSDVDGINDMFINDVNNNPALSVRYTDGNAISPNKYLKYPPNKFVAICHSMGGLVVRDYILSSYYRNDISHYFTINTPHEGSPAAYYLSSLYQSGKWYIAGAGAADIAAGIIGGIGFYQINLTQYGNLLWQYSGCRAVAVAATFGAAHSIAGYEGDGHRDLKPNSEAINRLRTNILSDRNSFFYNKLHTDVDVPPFYTEFGSSFYEDHLKNNKVINSRMIYSKGVPTPSPMLYRYGDWDHDYTNPFLSGWNLPGVSIILTAGSLFQNCLNMFSDVYIGNDVVGPDHGRYYLNYIGFGSAFPASVAASAALFNFSGTMPLFAMRNFSMEMASGFDFNMSGDASVPLLSAEGRHVGAYYSSYGLFPYPSSPIEITYKSPYELNDLINLAYWWSTSLASIFVKSDWKGLYGAIVGFVGTGLDVLLHYISLNLPDYKKSQAAHDYTIKRIQEDIGKSGEKLIDELLIGVNDSVYLIDPKVNVLKPDNNRMVKSVYELNVGDIIPVITKDVIAADFPQFIVYNEIPEKITGYMIDRFPEKCRVWLSVNYAPYREVMLMPNGYWEIPVGIGEGKVTLLEGANKIVIKSINGINDEKIQESYLILATIGIGITPESPEPNMSFNNPRPEIRATFWDFYGYIGVKPNSVKLKIKGPNNTDFVDYTSSATIPNNERGNPDEVRYTPSSDLAEGKYEVRIELQDNADNASSSSWIFFIDRTPPTIAIKKPNPVYNTNGNLNLDYTLGDNISKIVKDVDITLWQGATRIKRIENKDYNSASSHFFSWDKKDANRNCVTDGTYIIRIEAKDHAGNSGASETTIVIDNIAPVLASIVAAKDIITINDTFYPVTLTSTEYASLAFYFENKDSKRQFILREWVTNASQPFVMDLDFAQILQNVPEDGNYSVKVRAEDKAGNVAFYPVDDNVRIDMRPPVVFQVVCVPFVAGVDKNVTLSYKVNEEEDAVANKAATVKTTVQLIDPKSGDVLRESINPATPKDVLNTFVWDGKKNDGSYVAEGAYKFKVIAEDQFGNSVYTYGSTVFGAIPPAITEPVDQVRTDTSYPPVSGKVVIKGTAEDPDWNNSLNFKQYKLLYRSGEKQTPADINDLSGWQLAGMTVPYAYRNMSAAEPNTSVLPVQNNDILGVFDTTGLVNGYYTILLVCEEESPSLFAGGGAPTVGKRTIDTLTVYVDNSSASPALTVAINDLPVSVAFGGTNTLRVGYNVEPTGSIETADIFCEVYDAGKKQVAFKRYDDVNLVQYYGAPSFTTGSDLGFYIWKEGKTWHVRWNADVAERHFYGMIFPGISAITVSNVSSFSNLTKVGNYGSVSLDTMIRFASTNTGTMGGIDFDCDADSISFNISTNDSLWGSSINTNFNDYTLGSVSCSDIVYIGSTKVHPQFVPFTFQNKNTVEPYVWDGRLVGGALAPDGTYTVRVSAYSGSGTGYGDDAKNVIAGSQFEIKNISVTPKTFSPLASLAGGFSEAATISFGLTKPALVSAWVYDSAGLLVCPLFANKSMVGGNTIHTASWKGNYPAINSTQIKTSGNFYFRLTARASDSGQIVDTDVNDPLHLTTGVSIMDLAPGSFNASLDLIGEMKNLNGENIAVADGSSDFYFEAKPKARFYPPMPFKSVVKLTGEQQVTMYPYVPFAMQLRESYKQVNCRIKVIFNATIRTYYREWWWLPWDWGIRDNAIPSVNTVLDVNTSLSEAANFFTKALSWQAGFSSGKIGPADTSKANTILSINSVTVKVCAPDGTDWKVFPHYNPVASSPAASYEAGKEADEGGINFTTGSDFYIYNSYPSFCCDNNMFFFNTSVSLGAPGFDGFNPHTDDPSRPGLWKDCFNNVVNRYATWGSENTYYYPKTDYGYINKFHPEQIDYESTIPLHHAKGSPSSALLFDYPGGWVYDGPYVTNNPANAYNAARKVFISNTTGKKYYATTMYDISFSESAAAPTIQYPITRADLVGINNGYTMPELSSSIDATLSETRRTDQIHASQSAVHYGLGTYVAASATRIAPDEKNTGGWQSPKPDETYFVYTNYLFYSPSRNGYYADSSASQEVIEPAISAELRYGYTNVTANIFIKTITPVVLMALPPKYASYSVNAEIENNSVDPQKIKYTMPSWNSEYSGAEDPALVNGAIRSSTLSFNQYNFNPLGESGDYLISDNYDFTKHTGINGDDTNALLFGKNDALKNNPYVMVDDWDFSLKYIDGQQNNDFEIEKRYDTSDKNRVTYNDKFKIRLKPNATPKRIIAIRGKSEAKYAIYYFDNDSWKLIVQSDTPKNTDHSILGYWDVTKLTGRFTVVMKIYDSAKVLFKSQEIQIGSYVPVAATANTIVESPYKRTSIAVPPGAFPADSIISAIPVSLDDLAVTAIPSIVPVGPILKMSPSPTYFSSGPPDTRPVITFRYTYDEAYASQLVDANGLPLGIVNIYNINSNGLLERIPQTLVQADELNGTAGFNRGDILRITGAVDHFSYYAVLPGQAILTPLTLEPALAYTRSSSIRISGTAEHDRLIALYIDNDGRYMEMGDASSPILTGKANASDIIPDALKKRFSATCALPHEGANYIYAVYDGILQSPVSVPLTVIRDTIAPVISNPESASRYFSPNSDGKKDTGTYSCQLNEEGYIIYKLADKNGSELFSQRIDVTNMSVPVQFTWNGIQQNAFLPFSMTTPYPDGRYQVTIVAGDKAGNVSEGYVDSFIIDNKPPYQIFFSMPKHGYNANNVVNIPLTITVNEEALVKWVLSPVYAPSTRTVLASGNALANTALAFSWNGKVDDAYIREGEYVMTVEAEDLAGNSRTLANERFFIDSTVPIIERFIAKPSVLDPVSGSTTFLMDSSERGYYTLKITTPTGDVVRTLAENVSNETSFTYAWNGKDAYGNVLPEGSYFASLTLEDYAGNLSIASEASKIPLIIRVDNTPPIIAMDGIFKAFSPRSSYGVQDEMTTGYTLSDNESGEMKNVTASVYQNGVFVATIMQAVQSQGYHSLSWNGKHPDGSNLPEGVYEIRIHATDNAGNSAEASVLTAIDNSDPEIVLPTMSPLVFSPFVIDGRNDMLAIQVAAFDGQTSVSEAKVEIRNYKNELIRTIDIFTLPPTEGYYLFIWDGLDGTNARVVDGVYQLVFTAKDAAGNRTTRTMLATVDNTEPISTMLTSQNPFIWQSMHYYNMPLSITLNAADTLSGVEGIYFGINDGLMERYISPLTFGTTGSFILNWYAIDRAGNIGISNRYVFSLPYPDTTPPITIVIPSVTPYWADGKVYTSQTVTYTLSASDMIGQNDGTASGVDFTKYRIDAGEWASYSAPLSLAEGIHTIEYYSVDKLANSETIKLYSVAVDATAPMTAAELLKNGNAVPTYAINYVNTIVSLSLSAADVEKNNVASGIKRIEYQLPNGNWAPYTAAIEINAIDTEPYVASYRSIDNVDNIETAKTITIIKDVTSPVITVNNVVSGGCYKPGITATITVIEANPAGVVATLDGNTYVSGSIINTEGSHTIVVTAVDKAGNQTTKTVSFIVDGTVPVVSIANVVNGGFYKAGIAPTFTATDINLFAVNATLNGTVYTTGTPITSDGVYTLQVTAFDKADNSATQFVAFTVDGTSPVVTIAGVTNGAFYLTPVSAQVAISDLNLQATSVTLNGDPYVSGTLITGEGQRTIIATAQDKAGNETTRTVTFSIDTQAPRISITGAENGGYYRPTLNIFYTAEDVNLVSLSAMLDKKNYISGDPITKDGSHTLTVTAKDKYGRVTTKTITFTIDGKEPIVIVAGVADGKYYRHPVMPIVLIHDENLSNKTATLNGKPFTPKTWIKTDGNYTLVADAVDKAGNRKTVTVKFVIDRKEPIIAISGVTDDVSYTNAVTPVITVTDENIDWTKTILVRCEKDDHRKHNCHDHHCGDTFVSGTTIANDGSYVLIVFAKDKANNISTKRVSFSVDTQSPVIAISGISDGGFYKPNTAVSFSASDVNLVSCTATLDGAAYLAGTPIKNNGVYTLVVKATDKAGHIAIKSLAFTIDGILPIVSITGVENDGCYLPGIAPSVNVLDMNLLSSTITLNNIPYTSGTAITAEGTHTLYAYGVDRAGNFASKTIKFTIDGTTPAITISGAENNGVYNRTLTIDVSVSDANLKRTYITLNNVPTSSRIVVSGEGAHTIHVEADDKAGNRSMKDITFVIDMTLPVVLVEGVVNNGTYTKATIGVKMYEDNYDAARTSFKLDNQEYAQSITNGVNSGGTRFYGLAIANITNTGAHTLAYSVTDKAGNKVTGSVAFTITPFDMNADQSFYANFDSSTKATIAKGDKTDHSGVKVIISGGYLTNCVAPGVTLGDVVVQYKAMNNMRYDRGTFAMWVKPNWTKPTNSSIVSFGTSTLNKLPLGIYVTKTNETILSISGKDNKAKSITATTNWAANRDWTYIGFTWSSEQKGHGTSEVTLSFFINGTVVGTLSMHDPSFNDIYWMLLGYGKPDKSWTTFTGKLDETRVYEKALSVDEIKALYEAEKARISTPTGGGGAKPMGQSMQGNMPDRTVSEERSGLGDLSVQ